MDKRRLFRTNLINDMEIDENLFTDEENEEKTVLRSRQIKKEKKKKTKKNKVMTNKDTNLINLSESVSSSDNDQDSSDNILADYVNIANEDSLNDFKNQLDLNLKKKKRIFVSNDTTDFLNFIISEQQKIKKNSVINCLYEPKSDIRLKKIKKKKFYTDYEYLDDADDEEDLNSEISLLLSNELSSDDDFNIPTKSSKIKRFYKYFYNFFKFEAHVDSKLNITKNSDFIDNSSLINHEKSDDDDNFFYDKNLLFNDKYNFTKKSNNCFNLNNFLNFKMFLTNKSNNRSNYFNKHATELVDLTRLNQQDDDDKEDWDDGGTLRLIKPNSHLQDHESMFSIMIQVFIPFLIAGFGTVGAGLVLDLVQHWKVFQNVSEIFILVPALLGLKGNLEMTLASRLSTQANLGNLNSFKSQLKMATGNMALIQCQATVVGFLAAMFAIAVNWLPSAEFNLKHGLLLCASSLLTATIASFILGVIMIIVVILSHKCNINPDNVATPIAASLGDLTTLALLSQICSLLYNTIENSLWICVLLIVIMILLIPFWCYIAHRNRYTRSILYTGWTPVVSAMAISSFGGCILDFAVSRFKGIAVFQPVINGVGGNLVAVQASRISTFLHQKYYLGELGKRDKNLCLSPLKTFFAENSHAKTAKVLLLLVVPGHLIFLFGIHVMQAGHTSITPIFLEFYLVAALIQVSILLYLAQFIVFWMWKNKIDPDNSAIPYLTSLGDLIGTGLLSLCFYLLYSISDKDSDVGE